MKFPIIAILTFFSFFQINAQVSSCDTVIERTVQFCKGSAVIVNQNAYAEPGLVLYVVQGTTGCDTSYRVALVYSPIPRDTVVLGLLPDSSVTIAGTAYTEPGFYTDTLVTPGSCDTLRTYRLVEAYDVVADTCDYPGYFLKVYGDPDRNENARAIAPASDGGFYLGASYIVAASNPDFGKPLLSRYDAFGRLLWARKLKPNGTNGPISFDNAVIQQLFEDSEGKVAGTLQALTGFNYYSGVVFRYDPVPDTFMWVKLLNSGNQRIQGFKELSPGGNYLLFSNPTLTTGVARSELWQFNRQDGQVVGGLTDYYETGTSFTLFAAQYDNKALYMAGSINPSPFSAPGDTMLQRPMLAKVDSLTGAPIWAKTLAIQSSGVDSTGQRGFYRDLVIAHGQLAVVEGTTNWYNLNDSTDFHVQFFDYNGNLLKSKGYSWGDESRAQASDMEAVEDGYLIYGSTIQSDYGFLMKINTSGDLMWLKRIIPGAGAVKNNRMCVKGKDLYLAGSSDAFYSDLFALKANQQAEVNESCTKYFEPINADVYDVVTLSKDVNVSMSDFIRFGYDAKITTSSVAFQSSALCVKCGLPPCTDVTVNQTITFCPDETVTINGISYGLPGIVRDTIKIAGGCDSINVYTLEYVPSPVPLLFSFNCPPNIFVQAPAESSGVVITYDQPFLSSNCPCPNADVSLWQGLASGAQFPIGTSTVSYVGSDDCGNSATCSFNVTVEPEKPCDVKIADCIKYELLRVDTLGTGYTYFFRVTNNCNAEMDYSRFQLAGGIALSPVNESEYIAPSGRKYLIRNPHFTHIRFKTIGTGIKNGESDVFVYSLPLSAQMAFINVGTKLRDGRQFEAYMTDFGCSSPATANRSYRRTPASENEASLEVFPNPARQRVSLSFDTESAFATRIYGPDGRLLFYATSGGNAQRFDIPIPAHWTPGVYMVECIAETGQKATRRLVIN